MIFWKILTLMLEILKHLTDKEKQIEELKKLRS